jgi:hypothetical protein
MMDMEFGQMRNGYMMDIMGGTSLWSRASQLLSAIAIYGPVPHDAKPPN